MTYFDACAWQNGMKLTGIGVHENIKIYTKHSHHLHPEIASYKNSNWSHIKFQIIA